MNFKKPKKQVVMEAGYKAEAVLISALYQSQNDMYRGYSYQESRGRHCMMDQQQMEMLLMAMSH